MTTTDRLRALLDERGVEHEDFKGDPLAFVKEETAWGEVDKWGNYDYWIAEYFDGTTLLNISNPTPEQVIEATLGSDLRAENEKLRELVQDMWFGLYCPTESTDGCPQCPFNKDGECFFERRIRELGIKE